MTNQRVDPYVKYKEAFTEYRRDRVRLEVDHLRDGGFRRPHAAFLPDVQTDQAMPLQEALIASAEQQLALSETGDDMVAALVYIQDAEHILGLTHPCCDADRLHVNHMDAWCLRLPYNFQIRVDYPARVTLGDRLSRIGKLFGSIRSRLSFRR